MLAVKSVGKIGLVASALGTVFLVSGSSPTMANDGGISMGGSPKLLKGHPSVIMQSEIIRLNVKSEYVEVDCNFVFVNRGKKCTVRMGFPDQGFGADNPDEDKSPEDIKKAPAESSFKSFRSWVDGKEVPTNMVRASEAGQSWHTKMVTFPAHSTVKIRDLYIQTAGGGISRVNNKECRASEVAYILHTGSSWHGNIGKSTVMVKFSEKWNTGKIEIADAKSVSGGKDDRGITTKRPIGNLVVWSGPCKPKVNGQELTFERTNWRPKAKDDISVSYHYQSFGK